MDKKGAPTSESLTAEIDDAVDDLFSEFEQIEIDPLTSEVIQVSPETSEELETLVMESDEEEADLDLGSTAGLGQDILETADDLLSQSDHALLSLEWEISPANIKNAKQLLSELKSDFFQKGITDAEEVLETMGLIIDAMGETPGEIPTTGPKALKDALVVLRGLSEGKIPQNEIPEEIDRILPALRASLPQGRSEIAFETVQGDDDNSVDLDFGGDNPEPVAVTDAGDETEEDEEEAENVKVVHDESLSSPEDQVEPEKLTSSGDIPEALLKVIRSNVSMLDQCIDRVGPLEKLFGRTPGYDKLHLINKKLREQLELQKNSLARAIDGDYQAFSQRLSSPIQNVRVSSKGGYAPCPWHKLTVARWKGSMVGFIPDQVAYLSDQPLNAYEKYGNNGEFPLKNLKKWPWSKINALLQGELAQQDEKELGRMKIQVLQHPGVFQSFAEPADDNYILILSHGNNSGSAFLDSPTENISISIQWEWISSVDKKSILAGHLLIHGEYLPVLDLARLG